MQEGSQEREDRDADKAQKSRKGSTPARRAINRHLYRHHGGATMSGTTEQRICAHDDLHWSAQQSGRDLGHSHLPYQDGESEADTAERLLAEGMSSTTKESPDEGSAGGS